MPKLKHNFVQGKMNKDLDERLVPNGQYRDALNIQVSSSEGSDVGAVENILGNTKQNKKTASVNWDANFGLGNPKSIGVVKDSQNEKLYWFVTSDSIDVILEYDQSTGFIAPVLVDTGTVLDFNKANLITGVNVFDGMLAWTDDRNEPRIINIATFKAGSTQSGTRIDTHTSVYGRSFIDTDITVIKPKPKTAPTFTASASQRTGSGSGITPVYVNGDFTELVDGEYVPREVGYSTGISTDTAHNWQVDDIIIMRASRIDDNNFELEYEIRAEVTAASGSTATITILSISQDLARGTYTWECLLEEDEPMFQFQFPRFAYRWKYKNNEFSAFSPWTKAVFVADKFRYASAECHNEGMSNNLRKLVINGFESAPADCDALEILYKDSSENIVYVVDEVSASTTSFTVTSELIYKVVDSNQMIRPYDNVPRKAKAQEIIGNRLVYGNYVQNYDVTAADTDLTLSVASSDITEVTKPEESVKSLRTYQVGIVYLDEYGRETPVFTNDTATVQVPKTASHKVNTLKVAAAHTAPSWATHFKYYIKDSSNEYYNVILDRYYDSDDGNLWLSIPSAERNKVKEGDYIILKKEHDTDDPVNARAKYKILDISNEAPESVGLQRKEVAISKIKNNSGTATQGEKVITFDGFTPTDNPEFLRALHGEFEIRLKELTNNTFSNYYKGAGGSLVNPSDTDAYQIDLEEALGSEWSTITNGNFEVYIYHKERINLLEFEGKFFAKITRDVTLENSIIYNYTDDIDAYEELSANDSRYSSSTISAIKDESDNDPLDTVVAADFAWDGHDNEAYSEVFRPQAGSNKMGLGYFQWTSSLNSGAVLAFQEQLKANSVIQLYDSNNGWSGPLEVTAVSQGSKDRSTGTEDLYYWTITLRSPLGPEYGTGATNVTRVRLLKRKRNLPIVFDENSKVLSSPNPAVFETEPREAVDLQLYYEATDAIAIANLGTQQTLPYFNCYTFGNGVESDRINDDFNAKRITKGVKVSTVLDEPYAEERRSAGMVYGGLFNSISGVNELNQFIAGIKSTKDLNPAYGSIQKLHARDTDLIALCEDKIFRILANKDALYNADGNTNITSTNNVLGQSVPFAGEFGISKNPASFASYGFRAYFTDKSRGTVIRLSRDGITEIADKGMSDYFTDKLSDSNLVELTGSYDESIGAYIVTFYNDESVSFKERVDGWVTRLSFTPEAAISLNNEYYTIKDGELWEHSNTTRSNFYGTQENTTVTPIFNDAPSSIKNFKTLSYEGDAGWTAAVDTDQQDGEVATWKKKENIYFNYIKGLATTWNNTTQAGEFDTSEFSIQGIGDVSVSGVDGSGFRLDFAEDINTSLQANVGDQVFVVPQGGSNIFQIGECTSVSGKRLVVDNDLSVTQPAAGDYIFFVKNSEINTSGIIGYYASAKMTTDSGSKKELFAVNSEVFISSE